MSVSFDVTGQPRTDTGKGASRRLRRSGQVPAIVYGGHKDPEMISIPHNELLRHLNYEAFFSHILDLNVAGQTDQVVLKDLQRHPAKPFILHVDFLRVSAADKIRMIVPIHFVNEQQCKAVKLGGRVSHTITEVEISCLPKDLPESIDIDMIDMEVGTIIHLSEIPLPPGVALAHAPDPDEPVLIIQSGHSGDASTEEEESEG